jgi:hypothetical protein
MNGSVTAIWVIVAVAVAGLAVWLGSVALAARKPHQEHACSSPTLTSTTTPARPPAG